MTGLKMIGIGRALPSRCVTNDDLSKIVDTNDAWISERTGIRRRYYCADGESTNTLIAAAAREALECAPFPAIMRRPALPACSRRNSGSGKIFP